MDIKSLLEKYDKSKITIAVLGSHSALDVCNGAKDEGYRTLVIAEKGRDKTYSKYFKTSKRADALISGSAETGSVDEVILVDKFSRVLDEEIQKQLIERNAIFIPHRSFEVYINDYDAIENTFNVPMFGNRKLLRSEERGSGEDLDQYKILDEAGIRYPKQFKNPSEIDRLCIVKVLEKERGFERAFFFADSEQTFSEESQRLISEGIITKEALDKAVIEEFVTGVQVNFNFFYDPLNDRLELMGTDTRRQTNLDGILRLTAPLQQKLLDANKMEIKYEEAGHIAVTVLESMLEQAFEVGEKFVAATKKLSAPGVIGPFGLQSMIIPGPPKKDIVVFDVSPRMPGSPGIFATPYSKYLYGKPISAGRRIALEIKQAIEQNKLEEVLT